MALQRLPAVRRKLRVAANVVAQLGLLLATGKLCPERSAGNHKRGIDFYPAPDFLITLVKSAYEFKMTHGYLPNLAAPSSFTEHLFVRKFFAPLPMPSLADKLTAREYVRARIGDYVLSPV